MTLAISVDTSIFRGRHTGSLVANEVFLILAKVTPASVPGAGHTPAQNRIAGWLGNIRRLRYSPKSTTKVGSWRSKYIYKYTEGDGKNKMLLGGKGANLCEMTQIGLRVPPGFVISTEACLDYIASNRLPDGVMDDVRAHMAWLEQETGKQFGGAAIRCWCRCVPVPPCPCRA
jgi:hypothetical protein